MYIRAFEYPKDKTSEKMKEQIINGLNKYESIRKLVLPQAMGTYNKLITMVGNHQTILFWETMRFIHLCKTSQQAERSPSEIYYDLYLKPLIAFYKYFKETPSSKEQDAFKILQSYFEQRITQLQEDDANIEYIENNKHLLQELTPEGRLSITMGAILAIPPLGRIFIPIKSDLLSNFRNIHNDEDILNFYNTIQSTTAALRSKKRVINK